jgi:hypothetical protein
MFLAIARLLWAFDFKRAVDEKTKQEIVPDMEDLTAGLFAMPEPFKANIIPRDRAKSQRIVEEWQKVSVELLDKDMQWKEAPQDLIWNDSLAKLLPEDEIY